mmetsp:Transcript_41978/g.76731  ORF Transcript_41978/g.76731 Transcript_41978/m.76731 type:complete len:203 (-) Transcript_41978:866-1474(-)
MRQWRSAIRTPRSRRGRGRGRDETVEVGGAGDEAYLMGVDGAESYHSYEGIGSSLHHLGTHRQTQITRRLLGQSTHHISHGQCPSRQFLRQILHSQCLVQFHRPSSVLITIIPTILVIILQHLPPIMMPPHRRIATTRHHFSGQFIIHIILILTNYVRILPHIWFVFLDPHCFWQQPFSADGTLSGGVYAQFWKGFEDGLLW